MLFDQAPPDLQRAMIPKELHQELLSICETKNQLQFSTFLLLFLVAILQLTSVHAQTTLNDFDCCAVKKVEGKYSQ